MKPALRSARAFEQFLRADRHFRKERR
jgi:hypothetical protein